MFLGGNQSGTFDAVGGATVIRNNQDATYIAGSSFTGSGTHRFSGGTTTFSANTTIQNLAHSTGVLVVTGGNTLTLAGTATLTGGQLGNAVSNGLIRNTGTLNYSGTSAPGVFGNFANAGTINHSNTATVTAYGAYVNEATGQYLITSNTGGLNVSGGATSSLINQGLIRRSAGTGVFTINASVVGTPSFQNDGTIELQTGSMTSTGAEDATHNGTFNLSSGTAYTFSNGTQSFGTGASIIGAGTSTFSTGTMNFTDDVVVNSAASISGTIQVSDTKTLVSAILWDGRGGQITTTGTGKVRLQGATAITATNVSVNGQIESNSTTTLVGSGSILFANAAARFTNLSTGTFTINSAAAASASGVGTFVNQGLFQKIVSGNRSFSTTMTNQSGDIQASNGNLSFDGGGNLFQNTDFTIGASSAINFNSGSTWSGAITGTGSGVLALGPLPPARRQSPWGRRLLTPGGMWQMTLGSIVGTGALTVNSGTLFTNNSPSGNNRSLSRLRSSSMELSHR